jgi:hypothetical protein
MALARRGDGHLIDTVVSELNERIPPDAREEMVERLGAPSLDLPARLRQDIREQAAVRSRTQDALLAIGDWLPADLRAELHTILGQG